MKILFTLFFLATTNAGATIRTPVNISFHAKWWSAQQMHNLNIDNPPPKETDVEIKKWEFTDPVSVPHPDEISVEALFGPADQDTVDAVATAKVHWTVGKLNSPASAKREKEVMKLPPQKFSAKKGSSEKVRFANIGLKTKMDALFAKKLWPYQIEFRVEVSDSSGKKIGAGKGILPMQAGD